MKAGLPANNESDITVLGKPVVIGEGIAIPIVKVRLQVGDQILEKDINDKNVNAVFELSLEAGETIVESWFVKADGSEQNAYYTYVSKI